VVTLIVHSASRNKPTLAHLLHEQAADHGGKPVFTFVQDDLSELRVTCGQLYRAASAVALKLSECTDRGKRALLLLPPGPDYVIAFLGCLLASVVAVPCYPPLNRRNSARIESVVRDCDAALALVARGQAEKLKALVDGVPHWLEIDGTRLDGAGVEPLVRPPRHEDLCFLQYTSGSTGAPKGVRVTHRNLMANLEQIRRAFQPPPDFVGVSWLPPYHDMGLIGGLLEPVYAGGHHVILSPASFLQQPLRWLRYISEHRAAYAGGPNFAFELCARRATQEQKAGLDLSAWRVAFCGAEPLRADTLERFVEAFEPCGFRREALLPCYGLAEATLLVTAQPAQTGPVYRDQEDGRRQVSSGEPGEGVEVVVVDPCTRRLVEPGATGEIWVAGENVADGYWGNEEATQQTFGATLADEPHTRRYLRTGDLGSMHGGHLFVAGRLKDVLILGGRNVYPQDVEQASFNSHAGLRKDAAAVFSVAGEATEEMVVVQELEPRRVVESDMIGSIAAAVVDETGVQPHAIVLVKAGGIPRTSSGKIRRSQCKADYESGRLPVLASRFAASQPTLEVLSETSPVIGQEPRPSRSAIEAWLKQRLGEHLGVDPGAVDAAQPFAFHGVSSLLAVQLVGSLGQWLGRPLSPTLLWDHPSPSQLAGHLAGETDGAKAPAAVAHGLQRPLVAGVEPIAVVGLACRFPGADDAYEFWDLLHGGRDAVGPVPAERLQAGTFIPTPDAPPHTRVGGFLRQVDQFDAHFFGISPVEAERIDPQQRLVLEVAWEALEDAAIAPSSLAGSLTGVYIGISAHEYEQHQTAPADAMANLYAATGSALSVAPNRVSYLLDLRGPSMAIDTACSSSLVSLHLACQGLRHGETDLALAGGVNLILSDEASVAFAAAGMLSPQGRCKTFDESADGYVRGEGCGVVVLKRLSDAQRDGDRVRAVILGSAVHQDGRSNGLVAPNGLAQAEVIHRALQHAGVSPAQISYIEAHGTGTALGDPIEFNALKRVFQDSDAHPCAVGSVKSSIGHLEAAAGIAGVIKTVLSLEHETIPPHLHHRRLNPNCSLQGRSIEVPVTARPWPAAAGRRLAGVSSFGFGGTIAHLVLSDAPSDRPASVDVPLPYQLLPLSAKSPAALERLTDGIAQALREGATSLADAAVTLQTGRDAFAHRRLVIGSDAGEAAHWLAQRDKAHVFDRRCSAQPAPVAFMFPGQGSQHARMAWQLYRHVPLFRHHVDAGLRALEAPLREELRLALLADEAATAVAGEHAPLARTGWAQPALFIVEHALARLWIECGIQPAAMIGHSLGEYVAACVAGVFTLEEGAALVAARARMMQAMPAGAMVGVALDEARASTYCSEGIVLAAVNAPQRCVFAGSLSAVDALVARLVADGVSHQRLRTSHAFHSPAMTPVMEMLRERVRAVDLRPPRIAYISNVTGTWITAEQATDPGYWARQLCVPVRFSHGLSTLIGDAGCTLIEVGPGSVLGALARQNGSTASVAVLPSLAREGGSSADLQAMLTSLGRLWLEGHAVQWKALHRPGDARRAALPTYPFERQRCWLDATPLVQPISVSALPLMHTSTVAQAAAHSGHSIHQLDGIRQQLVDIVAELLHSEPGRVDPDVHLIELGADSLLIVQAMRRIEQAFGVTLTVRQLFEELTTISRIAAYLAETLPESPQPEPAQQLAPPAVSGQLVSGRQSEPHAQPHSAQHVWEPTRTSAVPAHPGVAQPRQDHGLDAVERVLSQQLHVMQLQLAALQNSAAASVAALPLAIARPTEPKAPAAPSERAREAGSQTPSVGGTAKFVPYQPARTTMQSDPMRQLQSRQKQYLEDFITRYVQRTHGSKEFAKRNRVVLADYRASAVFRYSVKEMLYPIVCDRSLGSRVWDVDGNEYIDLTMGFGVNFFGHRPDFIEQAMRAQLEEGWQLGPQSELAGEVAQLVNSLTGMERVAFTNSGTEAVILALRLARLHTGRPKIAFFSGSYHGWGNDTIALNDGARGTIAMAPGLQPGTEVSTLVLDYGSPQALETIRAHAHELAAILVEPVQSRLPEFQPREFLHELRALTAEHGIALIFDEVITGFRLHPGGAQAFYGIRADIATYGKVAGGGMPLGIVAGAPRWLDGVDGGRWEYGDDSYPKAATTFVAGTFCKHPLTLAASRAALQRLRDEGPALQQRLERRTAGLVERLNNLFDQAQLPIKAVHCGSLFRLHTPQNIDLLYYNAIAKGLYIWEGRSMFLSTAHTDDDVDRVVEIFAASIRELQDAGIFPVPPSGPSGISKEQGSIVHAGVTGAVESADARQATFPLTATQRGICIECQLDDEAALAYNSVFALRLQGPLRPEALHRAVAEVVARHDSLRTVIDEDGQRQHVLPRLNVPLQHVDLSGSAKPDEAVHAWHLENNRRRFDVSAGPLLRTDLLRLAEHDHLLVISMHHVITDGVSQAQMLQEIALCYSAACDQVAPVLPRALPYADYVAAYERYMSSDRKAADAGYWLEQFRTSVPGPLALPAGKNPGAQAGSRSEYMQLVIEGERYAKLQAVGSSRGCTLFMTLLAAVGVLLHRFTGQEDIVLGVPMTAGRDDDGRATLLGCTLNLIPILCQTHATEPFSKCLSGIKQRLLEALRHADYPFASLVKALGLPSDSVRRPLAPVMFNLNRVSDVPSFKGLACQLAEVPVSFGPDELFIDALQLPDCLDIKFRYKVDFFDRDGLQRMVEAFDVLLDSIVAGMDQPLGGLPVLRPPQRAQLLYEFNNTEQAYELLCVHHLFEAQARRTPDAPALVFEGRSLSYRDANEQANRLAHHLVALGVQPDARVAIAMHRSADLLIALLATLKAGAAYVPLDPEYPAQRLAHILSDSAPAVLLTQQALLPATRAMVADDASVLCVDVELPRLAANPCGDPPARAGLENLAYVIHTSGSTGTPKGVMVEHRALANFLCSMQQAPGMDNSAVLLAVTSVSFDIAALELYLPLLCGGTVVIASRQDAQDSERLATLIERHGVNVMQATPATWRVLLDQDWSRFPPLKVLCGGEALQPALAHELLRRAASVWNLYGPTETTVWSAAQELRPGDVITIGRPMANTRLHVLDAQQQLVPIGVPGELYIGGAGLARGYLNQSRLTAERFVTDPFRPSERLYKTGDLARYLPDGRIECLGRLDHQVKIRGFRVELGEIEHALLQFHGVREAVVTARDDATGEKRLVAYVVPSAEIGATGSLDVQALRNRLSLTLPAYMVPAAFVMLQALPLTPNGKIDRKALPAPDADALVQQPYMTPQTATERALAHIWSELLELPVERIGRDDDFFALGGHSLAAMTLLARIRKAFDVPLSLRVLFDTRTVGRLADAVDALRVSAGAVSMPSRGIERVAEQADYEVSAAQRRLWLLHQLDRSSTAYHVTALLELPATVDRSALQSALSQVLARHEALRTIIVAGEEGMPRQCVQPAWPVEVSVRRIDDEAMLQSHYERFISVPFDLSHGPLFRAEVLHTWDGRQLMAWCMHEIIADGSSAVILQREVQALLKADEPLKALPIQYKDFAAWQNRLLSGEDDSRQYWHEQFGNGLTRLELPYDHAPSAHAPNAAAQFPVKITGATHQALLHLCQRQQVTLAMLLQAAMAAWLSRLTGSSDIVLAVPVSGRDVSEVEPLIGFFLNTVLLRIPVNPEASFEQVVGASRQVTIDGLQHQHYPFEQLIEELDLPRPQNQFPVTPVLFNVLNFLERGTQGEVPAEHQPKTLGAKAELEFTVEEHADGLMIRCDYRTALFEPSTIEYLMQQLRSLLDQISQAPEQRIGALKVFADARVRQLRSPYLQFANELPAAPALPGVLERFAQQVRATPEATAIEWQGRQCSYAELQAHSDRIARQLQGLGCGVGDIVALLLRDPMEHIAAAIGAMKAGAVFMTLEASDPMVRLRTLVARVAPRWWIAEQATAEVLTQLGTSEVQGVWLGDVAVPGLTPLTVEVAPVVVPADADACYVFFTSGSTGQPKPILGRAQSLAQFIDWEINTFGLDQHCRVSQVTAPTFDAWLRDVFVPLCAGGTVCVPPQPKLGPDELLPWLDAARVTHVHCVPSLLRALLAQAQHLQQQHAAWPQLQALQRVCLSGEPVLPATVQAWHEAFGGRIELVNFYGASETTMIRCWHRITAEDAKRGFIPVGRPIEHTQAIVLNDQAQPCPPCVLRPGNSPS
jgi:amino acid adenylation domain-containing protein